jgi:hypothetical protein
MIMSSDGKPTVTETMAKEIFNDPTRRAELDQITADLRVSIDAAADKLYDLILGNSDDALRKLATSMMQRGYIEHVVGEALNAKAGERGPIFP